uniref:RNase H type-1 domain-containing protein n=2 Tax=Manihot esculenta TaxID=3983 RepID=A0A2C9V131_MANES
MVKVNFDAAVCRSKRKGSVASLARDSQGRVLAWHYRTVNHIYDLLILECIACRDALLMALHRGFKNIMVERDSLIVIQAANGHIFPLVIQGLIKDIEELGLSFNSISFTYA